MSIELESLQGEHCLSGAFFDAIESEYGQAQVLRFTLDGEHFEAIEDPDDGYRSSLQEVRKTNTAPQHTFEPFRVYGIMRERKEDEYRQDYILQFLHPVTEKCILEIGTSDIDDYYPGFVAEFHPENMTP